MKEAQEAQKIGIQFSLGIMAALLLKEIEQAYQTQRFTRVRETRFKFM